MADCITLPPKDRDRDIERVVRLLRDYCLGKPINVRVSIARPERTPDQLKYLWGVAIDMLSRHAGYEKDDVHEYLCGQFWGWKPKRVPGGETVDVPIRTTTKDENGECDVIDGKTFWDYVEFVQRVGARQGVIIPDPDPNYKIKRREDA
jgi:hypothetical protein